MNSISKIVKGNQSTFFWLLQFLPKARKLGAYTLFAFNHHIEKEVVKSNSSIVEKLEMLSAWREEVDNIFDKKAPQTEIGRKLYKNCMRFSLDKEEFVKLIEAYTNSVKNGLYNPTLAEYAEYSKNVYGSKIKMMLKMFNIEDKQVADLMAEFIHPVVALENMKEDCQLGFVYVPQEFLKESGVASCNPADVLIDPKLAIARNKMLELSQENLSKLETYYSNIDKNNLKIIRGCVNIYKRYLDIMQNRGMEVIAPKPKVSNFSKAKIILKSMLG